MVGGAEAYTAACRACYHRLAVDKSQPAPLTEGRPRPQQKQRQVWATPVSSIVLFLFTDAPWYTPHVKLSTMPNAEAGDVTALSARLMVCVCRRTQTKPAVLLWPWLSC